MCPEPPKAPETPEYYPVVWHLVDGQYCIDRDNATHLIKNIRVTCGYMDVLKEMMLDE